MALGAASRIPGNDMSLHQHVRMYVPAESSCGSRKTCDIRVYGLVFPDPTCFVIINNRGSDIIATVQVYNFYDCESRIPRLWDLPWASLAAPAHMPGGLRPNLGQCRRSPYMSRVLVC